jgi:predicted O-methyltransferase YrrM
MYTQRPCFVPGGLDALSAQDRYVQPSPEISGWMTPDELQWLYERAKEHRSIVEVGSWRGRSTHALLSGCWGEVTAVDHFGGSPGDLHSLMGASDTYAAFMRNCGGFSNLRVLQMDSVSAADICGTGFDMIFLDGSHSFYDVLADLRAWAPKLAPSGLLCGHDADKRGVSAALQQFFGLMPPVVVGTIWQAR